MCGGKTRQHHEHQLAIVVVTFDQRVCVCAHKRKSPKNYSLYHPRYVWQESVQIRNTVAPPVHDSSAVNHVQIHESAFYNWDSLAAPMCFRNRHSLCILSNIAADVRNSVEFRWKNRTTITMRFQFFLTCIKFNTLTCPARMRLSKMASTSKISSLSTSSPLDDDFSTGMFRYVDLDERFLLNDLFRDIFFLWFFFWLFAFFLLQI